MSIPPAAPEAHSDRLKHSFRSHRAPEGSAARLLQTALTRWDCQIQNNYTAVLTAKRR